MSSAIELHDRAEVLFAKDASVLGGDREAFEEGLALLRQAEAAAIELVADWTPAAAVPDGWSLADWSRIFEVATGADSVATIGRMYEEEPGAALVCCWPGCRFRRHDPEAMWRHVHASRAHLKDSAHRP